MTFPLPLFITLLVSGVVSSLAAHLFDCAYDITPPEIDLTKPTNSPAMNELFAFCKNNGISAQIFTEGKTQFLGFKM